MSCHHKHCPRSDDSAGFRLALLFDLLLVFGACVAFALSVYTAAGARDPETRALYVVLAIFNLGCAYRCWPRES